MFREYGSGVIVNSDKQMIYLTDGEKTVEISLSTWARIVKDFKDAGR